MEPLFYEKPLDARPEAVSQDPQYFKKVKIGSLALYKMTTHACSGGNIEVMGLMMGKVLNDTFVVTDAFPLPVEGTETRVSAGDAANAFMIEYTETNESLDLDFVLGWYHSHPGYSCWLSGIDVATQQIYQSQLDPFVAVVIDPINTNTQGQVQIGAFRTFPNAQATGRSSGPAATGVKAPVNLPASKIEEQGAHADKYYSLAVEYYRSPNDQKILQHLWDAAWIDTLAKSPLNDNMSFFNSEIKSIIQKIDKKDAHCTQHACGLAHHACRSLILEQLKKQIFARNVQTASFDVQSAIHRLATMKSEAHSSQ
jgi:COP9 signalosome complex subunit 5